MAGFFLAISFRVYGYEDLNAGLSLVTPSFIQL